VCSWHLLRGARLIGNKPCWPSNWSTDRASAYLPELNHAAIGCPVLQCLGAAVSGLQKNRLMLCEQ
jgi:hypothetical protein